MVTYTSAFLAAANLLAVAQAAPAWSDNGAKCQVVVEIIEGPGIWVPAADPTAAWSSWDPKATTTTTSADAWASWTTSSSAKATTTTTESFGGGFWSHSTTSTSTPSVTTTWSGTPTTTSAPITTSTTTSTTTTTTTTTTTPASAPTCAASSYSFNYSPAGSCGCSFSVDCNYQSDYSKATFWEQNSGAQVASLADCIAQCNNNSACQASIWSAKDPADTQDYKRCWQVSGLGGDVSTGFGQIARKGSCSGTCSSTYNS